MSQKFFENWELQCKTSQMSQGGQHKAKDTQLFEWNCWWLKSCTSWYGEYPIIYRVLYIPGGAGFLPSTEAQRHPSYPATTATIWSRGSRVSEVGLRIPSKLHSIQAKQTLRFGIQLPGFCLQLLCASLASSSCVSYRDAVINPNSNHSTVQHKPFLTNKIFENDLTPPNQ